MWEVFVDMLHNNSRTGGVVFQYWSLTQCYEPFALRMFLVRIRKKPHSSYFTESALSSNLRLRITRYMDLVRGLEGLHTDPCPLRNQKSLYFFMYIRI
jgi:hypothetical protein